MEQIQYRDTVAVTDLGAYKNNIGKIKRFVGTAVGIMAVIKANAYGHGLVECAGTALEAGASMLCVALVSEGVILRKAGINAPFYLFERDRIVIDKGIDNGVKYSIGTLRHEIDAGFETFFELVDSYGRFFMVGYDEFLPEEQVEFDNIEAQI